MVNFVFNPIRRLVKGLLTADHLCGVRSDEESKLAEPLFIDQPFIFNCHDGEEIKGIISAVEGSVEHVEVKFLTMEKASQEHYLFFDCLRESQGTEDYYRWSICSGKGQEYISKLGQLEFQ